MEVWNIYLSIRLCSNPERALELIGYQRLICSANKLLPLNAWLQYDNKFRTIAASNTHLRWDQRHPDLWLEALALGNLDKQSSKRWPCPYCIKLPFIFRKIVPIRLFVTTWNRLEQLITELPALQSVVTSTSDFQQILKPYKCILKIM